MNKRLTELGGISKQLCIHRFNNKDFFRGLISSMVVTVNLANVFVEHQLKTSSS